MRNALRILPITLCFLVLPHAARAEPCKLQTYASSWMATGTPFSVKCPSGDYSGHLVSTPARRFFRRGHLMLVFDQPVALRPKKEGDEGKIEAGRTRQITNRLVGGGVSVGSKDLVDGISGTVFKSGYMIPITGFAFAFFSTGGDVLLKPGYELEIISREQRSSESTPGSPMGN
jgi:hypothetical protein